VCVVCSMGAVLHFRICKGCLVQHGHSHLHSCGSGGEHSHSADRRHSGVSDDVMLPVTPASSNGYQLLLSEGRSDVELLVNAGDDDRSPTACAVERPHHTTNVNIRAAMVHVIGDLIQSFGVFTAAIIVLVKVCCSQSGNNSNGDISRIVAMLLVVLESVPVEESIQICLWPNFLLDLPICAIVA